MKVKVFNNIIGINDDAVNLTTELNTFISGKKIMDIKQAIIPTPGKSGEITVVTTVMYND